MQDDMIIDDENFPTQRSDDFRFMVNTDDFLSAYQSQNRQIQETAKNNRSNDELKISDISEEEQDLEELELQFNKDKQLKEYQNKSFKDTFIEIHADGNYFQILNTQSQDQSGPNLLTAQHLRFHLDKKRTVRVALWTSKDQN